MAEILLSFDLPPPPLSLSVSVRSGPVNQTSFKRLKLRISHLTSMFPGPVRTWPLKNFSKRGLGHGHVTPKFLGVKCPLHLAEICRPTLTSAFSGYLSRDCILCSCYVSYFSSRANKRSSSSSLTCNGLSHSTALAVYFDQVLSRF